MQGVFLVAAELAGRGFTVSTTSRNAMGADLLITDGQCRKAWSVQVKTNAGAANFWLVGSQAADHVSESHVYVFVNLRRHRNQKLPPQFLVVPSDQVARKVEKSIRSTGSVWYSFSHIFAPDGSADSIGWEVFGTPG
jgi:hypothetical protein